MAIIDSYAAFRDRALQFGITEADVVKLKSKTFASFGAFTFIAVFSPNSPDDAALKASLTAVLERDMDVEDMARFRRLHFEANAVTISDAKRRTEATGEDTPKKVPAPERAARYDDQVRRLTGITMTTNLEPSHALLDRIQQQLEENQVAYVSPELCTSRHQEIKGIKKDTDAASTTIVEGPGRLLKISDHEPDLKTSVSCDYALRQALRRRALAYDQTGLASYESLERWSERLYFAMEQEPPPAYHAVSKGQIITADREMWIRIIERCRSGILPTTTTRGAVVRPIEAALETLMTDPTVLTFLAHLPKPASVATIDYEMNNVERESKRQKKNDGRAKSKGAGRGLGKGKGRGKGDKLPQALAGAWKTVKGQIPCKWFNMGQCKSDVSPGEKCSQGLHACMGPGCGDLHPFVECPKQRKNQKPK